MDQSTVLPQRTTATTTTIIKKVKYSNFQDFLIKHRIDKKKGAASGSGTDCVKTSTHTRIGGDESSGIYGGNYHISDAEYETFMQLYYNEIVRKNTPEYLTEKQLTGGNGPIAIDLDLHFALDLPERVYTTEHIEDLVDAYLAKLKDMYQFDEDSKFSVFIFEKTAVNRVVDKQITKDGLHVIIGLQMDHAAQCILRERMIPHIAELWGDFPLVNTWDDVFDKGISQGGTNWQLYGSRKPHHEAYQLTKVYDICFDPDDGEFVNSPGEVAKYLTQENITRLSVRYTGHPQFFYKTAFIQEIAAATNGGGGGGATGRRRSPSPQEDNSDFGVMMGSGDLSRIRTLEDLELYYQRFLESIPPNEYKLREIAEYTMALPESYYGQGSYSKWIRVGWALKHTERAQKYKKISLLVVWIRFSAKSSGFQCSDIPDMCDQWSKFERKGGGVTNRSIIYWAMHDNPTGFDNVRKETVGYYLDQTINSVIMASNSGGKNPKRATDYDITMVLYQMYKDEYVCTDIKNGIWYRFKNHRWKRIDSGTYLRKAISNELRERYINKANELQLYLGTLDPEDEKHPKTKARVQVILDIASRLGQTSDKKNIMTEARDLFYDSEFQNRLDSDPYLLCCKNGVVDFKEKTFRKGLPEDYLTKCTEVNYVPLVQQPQGKNGAPLSAAATSKLEVQEQLHDFMAKLFPDAELRKYMWDHLASTLIGTASVNQTFNNYIGVGANGKSVLTDLMSQTLGTYKVGAPISIFTQPRVKVGGTATEIVALQGARYVVMQEPSKGDILHEGPMKEYVSGVEPISARGLYMTDPVVFVPQAKFVVCCNEFMGVKSNDHGTWRRIRVVPFESLFTENPVDDDPDKPHQFKLDRYLKEKFPSWVETFLAMLVDRAYATNGVVDDCDTVLSASNKYREKQDYISEFIRDKVMRCPGESIRKSQLSEEFKIWYSINYGTRNPSPKDLHEYMDKQYGKLRNGVWKDVRLNDDRRDYDANGETGAEVADIEDELSGDIDFNEL